MSELLEPPHAARTETADPAVSPAPRRSARRRVRRLAVTVVGMTVLAFGVVLLVTPGPAIVIIPAGIAILATEYAWARRLMDRSKGYWEAARKQRAERKERAGRPGHDA